MRVGAVVVPTLPYHKAIMNVSEPDSHAEVIDRLARIETLLTLGLKDVDDLRIRVTSLEKIKMKLIGATAVITTAVVFFKSYFVAHFQNK